MTSGAQFAALSLVKPIVWFACTVVNWRSHSVSKPAYCVISMQICQSLKTKQITEHMLYIPYRGDKAETEVFSGFLKEAKMLDLAYIIGLLFLGEQKLSLKVCENLQTFLSLYQLNHFSRCLWVFFSVPDIFIYPKFIHSLHLFDFTNKKKLFRNIISVLYNFNFFLCDDSAFVILIITAWLKLTLPLKFVIFFIPRTEVISKEKSFRCAARIPKEYVY